mmetsp:Transcript_68417/g.192957  ORF Transcript_68417/g.192957 Transcript_68417/m.192957 type:complete len:342 (-) Transcript_68417:143-1168(-)
MSKNSPNRLLYCSTSCSTSGSTSMELMSRFRRHRCSLLDDAGAASAAFSSPSAPAPCAGLWGAPAAPWCFSGCVESISGSCLATLSTGGGSCAGRSASRRRSSRSLCSQSFSRRPWTTCSRLAKSRRAVSPKRLRSSTSMMWMKSHLQTTGMTGILPSRWGSTQSGSPAQTRMGRECWSNTDTAQTYGRRSWSTTSRSRRNWQKVERSMPSPGARAAAVLQPTMQRSTSRRSSYVKIQPCCCTVWTFVKLVSTRLMFIFSNFLRSSRSWTLETSAGSRLCMVQPGGKQCSQSGISKNSMSCCRFRTSCSWTLSASLRPLNCSMLRAWMASRSRWTVSVARR